MVVNGLSPKFREIYGTFWSDSNGQQKVEFEMDESKLSIDMELMKQKNVTSGYVRSIRCVVVDENGISVFLS